jgi:hypothetical protein
MEIGPVHNDQPSSGRLETEKIKKNSGLKATSECDRVEISNEARMKLAALADQALNETSGTRNQPGLEILQKNFGQTDAAGKLEAGRDDNDTKLTRVQDRIESGFYNRPDVKQKIAERLATELEKQSGKEK